MLIVISLPFNVEILETKVMCSLEHLRVGSTMRVFWKVGSENTGGMDVPSFLSS